MSKRNALLEMQVDILLSLVCLAVWVSPAIADAGAAPGLAPVNPAFERYIREARTTQREKKDRGIHTPGIVPSPMDLSHMKGRKIQPDQRVLAESALPASYDLRTLGRVTPVGDQHLGAYCGSCWTFATYGSLESCLLPGETWDFAENSLKNTHGFDPSCCDGGHPLIATACLARWSHPVAESDDPYAISCISPTGLRARKHVQAVDFLPDRNNALDNDNIKQAVMTHGAVYTTMYIEGAYYNPTTSAYYYSGTDLNHAICIVGWDDNYDKGNFLATPPGDGAFICKNSFGTDFGDAGYFYMSYYDSGLVENRVFRGAEPVDNYDSIYQHDWFGWVSSFGLGSETAWFGNVFTATADCLLAAASWYVPAPGSPYELYVYVDSTAEPTTGTLALSQSGVSASAGYMTTALDSEVPLAEGQKFSVVVKITTPGYGYPVCCDYALPGWSGSSTANPGESYVSTDGLSWTDLTIYNPTANACLKAFTRDSGRLVVTPDGGFSVTGPQGGPFSPSDQSYTLLNSGIKPLSWSAASTQPWLDSSTMSGTLNPGDSTIVSVGIGSLAEWMGPGEYSGTVAFTNATNGAGSTERVVDLSISSPAQPPHVSVSLAKRHANNAQVIMDGAVVTRVLNMNAFYVEAADRSAGIVVNKTGHGVTAGLMLEVTGTLRTNTSGEKYVQASGISVAGTGSIRPLMLVNRAIGGGDWHYEPVTGTGQQGVVEWRWVDIDGSPALLKRDVVGLNNIGLMVTATGRVTFSAPGYFYIDDGSGVLDSSENTGLRVLCPGVVPPAEDTQVKVTGISTCFKSGDDMYRTLRTFSQSDIEPLD